ncbi:hypothetical protein ABIB00_007905 [Bradyrhizobium sp. LB14.3]|uniref:hypothetical protein n=1 Tax=Bradyrhizobium sp. LB14.3 TaxID=3156328 RepID=UPI0033983608
MLAMSQSLIKQTEFLFLQGNLEGIRTPAVRIRAGWMISRAIQVLNRGAASSFQLLSTTTPRLLLRESDHQSLAMRCGVRLAARMNSAASKAERA